MRRKPYDVYVLFNGRVTELIGTKIKFEIKKILILNFEFNLIKVLLYPYVKLLKKVIFI